ncbi:MAG: Holliday junction resolvase RuvX [Planctomycetota bacterium]
MGGVLAIDVGTRKTGFAFADALRILSQPLDVVRAGEDEPELLEHIQELLDERDVSTLLVGLPLHLDGTESERSRAVLAFVERLGARFPALETVTWNEGLTTKEADGLLREAGITGRDAKARRDSWSALVLLRDWLNSGEPRGAQ